MYQDPERPLYGPDSPKQLAFTAKLRELCEKHRGRTLTLREIADECGCWPQWIRAIEQRALKKLRLKLWADPAIRETLKQLGESRSGKMFEAMLGNNENE